MDDQSRAMLAVVRALVSILDQKLSSEDVDWIKREAGEELMKALDAAHDSRRRALEWPKPIG